MTCYEKLTTWDKFSFFKNGKKVKKSIFLLFSLSENLDFWLPVVYKIACVMKNVIMDIISYSDVYNLIIFNTYFLKITIMTRVHKNGHNLACDQYFFLKLAPLFSTQTELSIHTKNSIFMKNPKWSQQVILIFMTQIGVLTLSFTVLVWFYTLPYKSLICS